MGLVENRSLAEQVNDVLLDWILSCRIKPGDRLVESTLAEQLGVSRTPVREALKTLAAHGFVRDVSRKGVVVSEVDIHKLEEVLDLRYLMEMYAAERGINFVTCEDIQAMRSIVEKCDQLVLEQNVQAYRQYVQRDCDLHRLIIAIAVNGMLNDFYEKLAVFLQIAQVRFSQTELDMTKGHREHRAILRAYENRDGDSLLEALSRHLTRSRKEILEGAPEL